jgi:hypothetical protein
MGVHGILQGQLYIFFYSGLWGKHKKSVIKASDPQTHIGFVVYLTMMLGTNSKERRTMIN